MSGRTLHFRDGELITNRKTDRRQSPKRPLLERLHELNDKCARRYPSRWCPDVRVGFILPKMLQPFVASGPHGAVNVHKGFVQVTEVSRQRCLDRLQEFFASVAKQREAMTITASVSSSTHPGQRFCCWIVVVRGAIVECGGHRQPAVYERAA